MAYNCSTYTLGCYRSQWPTHLQVYKTASTYITWVTRTKIQMAMADIMYQFNGLKRERIAAKEQSDWPRSFVIIEATSRRVRFSKGGYGEPRQGQTEGSKQCAEEQKEYERGRGRRDVDCSVVPSPSAFHLQAHVNNILLTHLCVFCVLCMDL